MLIKKYCSFFLFVITQGSGGEQARSNREQYFKRALANHAALAAGYATTGTYLRLTYLRPLSRALNK